MIWVTDLNGHRPLIPRRRQDCLHAVKVQLYSRLDLSQPRLWFREAPSWHVAATAPLAPLGRHGRLDGLRPSLSRPSCQCRHRFQRLLRHDAPRTQLAHAGCSACTLAHAQLLHALDDSGGHHLSGYRPCARRPAADPAHCVASAVGRAPLCSSGPSAAHDPFCPATCQHH